MMEFALICPTVKLFWRVKHHAGDRPDYGMGFV